jgi:hypothetical protein
LWTRFSRARPTGLAAHCEFAGSDKVKPERIEPSASLIRAIAQLYRHSAPSRIAIEEPHGQEGRQSYLWARRQTPVDRGGSAGPPACLRIDVRLGAGGGDRYHRRRHSGTSRLRAADVDDCVRRRDDSAVSAQQPGRFRIFLSDRQWPGICLRVDSRRQDRRLERCLHHDDARRHLRGTSRTDRAAPASAVSA